MLDELRSEGRAAWAVARRVLKVALRYRINAVNQVLQPLYQVLLPGVLLGATFAVAGQAVGLAETAGTTDVAGYLFLGMLGLMLAKAGFWDVAYDLKYEMDSGTLEPAWLTPTRRETFVIGFTLAGLVIASVSTIVLVGIGIVFFGARIAPSLVVTIPVLALTSIGVLGIGYLVGAIVLRMRDATFFVDATDFLFVALSGATFPIVVLPDAVRWIAYLLPTTYAVDLIRASGLGTPPLMPVPLEWAALVLTSIGFVWIGRRAWLATEHRLRVRGTLGQH
jgi:ABC-2 type transport system permease protein